MRSIFLKKPDSLALRLRYSGWGRLWAWVPVMFAAAVIATESTNTFSAEHTGRWLLPILEALLGARARACYQEINHVLRKTGHFFGYGTVCLTFLRAWLIELGMAANLGRAMWRLRACLLAVASTGLVASLDEWHQSFIPSRTGTPVDVLLDSCGAAVSCCLVWLFFWSRQEFSDIATGVATSDSL